MIRQTLDLSGVTPLNRTQIEHLVHKAGDFSSRIILEHRSRVINGKSMLGILSLGVTGHEPVILTVEGDDEEEAFQAVKTMLEEGVAPPQTAVDAEALMVIVKDRYQALLRDDLAGIYVHGSLAAGCFRWEHSDIDFLTVVRSPLTAEKKTALVDVLRAQEASAPPAGFEMSVILEKYCRNIPYPIPFELHYASRSGEEYAADPKAYLARMQGEDPDLTAHILNLHTHSQAVYGPTVSRMFDQVKREHALAALRYDVEDAPKHLHENPVYYVLNLARAAAYCREGAALSKKEGGEWALRHMASAHQRVIQAALNAYESGLDMFYDAEQAEEFCDDALEEIRQAK